MSPFFVLDFKIFIILRRKVAAVKQTMEEERRREQNIYKICRSIKRRDSSLYNALRSIYEDSIFVGEIAQLWPELPLLANLRCGLWYSPNFHSNCYFKSTDGHTNNLSFSTARLNLHVALLAGTLSLSLLLHFISVKLDFASVDDTLHFS